MRENKKITEFLMLEKLQPGSILLEPLRIESKTEGDRRGTGDRPDAIIEASLPDEKEEFQFVVESKSRSTPETIRDAVQQAKKYASQGKFLPLIQVPYLANERLEELEASRVSGVDLCGNGLVYIPNRLLILRTGNPNQYPDSRPLANPYRGRSAMVARILIEQPEWESHKELVIAIRDKGVNVSSSQVSKAISSLEEELIVSRKSKRILLTEPEILLRNLAHEWKSPKHVLRKLYRENRGVEVLSKLNSVGRLRWAVSGESSVSRYTVFGQGGPMRIAVSDLEKAEKAVNSEPETIPSFASLELFQTQDDGYYFANEKDENGTRWASMLQTWIELKNGDARQQNAAKDLKKKLLRTS